MNESDVPLVLCGSTRILKDLQILLLRGHVGHSPLPQYWYPDESTPAHYELSGVQESYYIRIIDDQDNIGCFGPIDKLQAFYAREFARPLILGLPTTPEVIMRALVEVYRNNRIDTHHIALGAIDCALWDLLGVQNGLPVWALLGQKQRTHIPAYASLLAYDLYDSTAQAVAITAKEEGYGLQKWSVRGLANDVDGRIDQLENAIAAICNGVGSTYPIAIDALGILSTEQFEHIIAAEFAASLAWLEDPVPPTEFLAFNRHSDIGKILIGMGETLYSPSAVNSLLNSGLIAWYTPDIAWNGGISGILPKIRHASSLNISTAFHGAALLPALHVAAVFGPSVVPFVEFHLMLERSRQLFLQQQYFPVKGEIRVPDAPGLGIKFNEQEISHLEEISFA